MLGKKFTVQRSISSYVKPMPLFSIQPGAVQLSGLETAIAIYDYLLSLFIQILHLY